MIHLYVRSFLSNSVNDTNAHLYPTKGTKNFGINRMAEKR